MKNEKVRFGLFYFIKCIVCLILCYWGCLIVDVFLEMSMLCDLLLVIIILFKFELIM